MYDRAAIDRLGDRSWEGDGRRGDGNVRNHKNTMITALCTMYVCQSVKYSPFV